MLQTYNYTRKFASNGGFGCGFYKLLHVRIGGYGGECFSRGSAGGDRVDAVLGRHFSSLDAADGVSLQSSTLIQKI
eukprot:6193311-Pleurochrysis_carterae.AAC.1